MNLSEVDISLNIQSNVNYPVQISILGNPYNLLDTSNATTEYRWDFTTFTFTTETQLFLQYKANNAPSFSIYSGQLASPQSLQGVVDLLNQLGIGFFQLYTDSGSTYIGTYNDNYTFGQINLYTPSLINPDFFFGTGFDLQVNKIIGYNGGLLVGGQFTTYNTTTSANGIILLNIDGSVNTSFIYGTGFTGGAGYVYDMAVQSNGKIIVVGDFTSYNGTPIVNIARLNTDGSLDTTFQNFGGFDSVVISVAVQTNDYIICGGDFGNYTDSLGVNAASKIARLTPNGAYDTFTAGTGFNVNVNVVKIQPDGAILIGGFFTTYNGTSANRIIRLTNTGSIDGTFVYGTGLTSGSIINCASIFVLDTGDILIGGKFFDYDGNACENLIKVSATGTFDNTFIQNSFGNIYATNTSITEIEVDSSGKIYIGGLYNILNGNPNGNISRLNSDGSVDTVWTDQNSFAAFNGSDVPTIYLYSPLTIIIGGNFSSFGGVPVYNILALKTF